MIKWLKPQSIKPGELYFNGSVGSLMLCLGNKQTSKDEISIDWLVVHEGQKRVVTYPYEKNDPLMLLKL